MSTKDKSKSARPQFYATAREVIFLVFISQGLRICFTSHFGYFGGIFRHNMTIIVDSHPVTELPDTVTEFYQRYPFLEAEATSFLLKSVRVFDKPEGVLYVTQKEYAVVKSDDKNVSVLGTDDATTCHIAVLVNRADSSVCLAHIDSADDLDDLSRMVSDVLGSHSTTKSNTSQLELSILGGYCDERDTSEMLTLELLHFCSQSSVNFHLKSFCVGYVNMKQCGGINWPIIYGACVDIHSDFTISPAKFKSNVRGPCLSLRSSRFLSRQCNTLYR